MKITCLLLATLCSYFAYAQDYANLKTRTRAVADSVQIDSVSINSSYLKVTDKNGILIDSIFYKVNFATATLQLNREFITVDSIEISYLPFPSFLTRTYKTYDERIIIANESRQDQLIALKQPNAQKTFRPFEGLQTTGSISRGVRVGNNQNSVVDSELDLRITGQLAEDVYLRASIQDANVPQQQNGYSQRLDEFEQIFIELYSSDWSIRAGDVDLVQQDSYFNNFTKRVQGISGKFDIIGDESSGYVQGAGALVRGIFNISQFTGQEGNQGPYKLTGRNNELYILIVSGSEKVYVNGVPLARGENADYVIDYNAGELRFNPTFPITSEMRISIEYQYSERNFTRFVGYAAGGYKTDKLSIESYIYTESDAKNQPLQQNLNAEQTAILALAGDDETAAIAPSAVPDSYSDNKVLYRKEVFNGIERFVYSQDPTDELFAVRFSFIGENQGNYVVVNDQAIANIFQYVDPINGIPQGSFEPIVKLFAPESLSIAGVKSSYQPSRKTDLQMELAASSNDLNKYSSLDDTDNKGFASRIGAAQQLIEFDSLSYIKALGTVNFIHEDFRNVERVYNIEFARDWNLSNPTGNQVFSTLGLEYVKDSVASVAYTYENLNYSNNYNGNRHNLSSRVGVGGWDGYFRASALSSNGTINSSTFNRLEADLVKNFKKSWAGARYSYERNKQLNTTTQELLPASQGFSNYEVYTGVGDTAMVYVEVGYRHRLNDSIRRARLQRVNSSNNYYLKSQLVQSENTQLQLFTEYRVLNSSLDSIENQVSLNSRLIYSQNFLKNKIQWNSVYETNSGTIAQQDFTYIEVDPGQGEYTWVDYNNDGIQDLNEFELAAFQDQGNYTRILLPNQIFLPSHQNKFSQIITLNPASWGNEEGLKGFLSHFYNQTSYLIDRKVRRENSEFDLNPFSTSEKNELGLVLNFRNSLIFNRGKQRFTTGYTYLDSSTRNLLSIGSISNQLSTHQLSFAHKVAQSWLFQLNAQLGCNSSQSENYTNRNYRIDDYLIKPKATYLLSDSARIDLFYELHNKENMVNEFASLNQQNFGIGFTFSKAQSYSIISEVNYVKNDFVGAAFSPVGFQLLEGLQPGKNMTWNLLLQKNITDFLDLNLAYTGRKSENVKTIHTGSVQLKAYF